MNTRIYMRWMVFSIVLYGLGLLLEDASAQESGFPRWMVAADAGLHMTKFYNSTSGRKYYWTYELPAFGLSVDYLPSVERIYEMRLSTQIKSAFRDDEARLNAFYWVAEWTVNHGLYGTSIKPFNFRKRFGKREWPTRLWVYGGVGYYASYVDNVLTDEVAESNGVLGSNLWEHGLVFRLWHVLYYDDYRRRHWSMGILFNIYLGLTRVADFHTIALTDFYLIYPMQWRFCYMW